MRNGIVLSCEAWYHVIFFRGKASTKLEGKKARLCTMNRGLAKPGINVAPKFYHDMAATHVQYMIDGRSRN
jgi:hypothetical protein